MLLFPSCYNYEYHTRNFQRHFHYCDYACMCVFCVDVSTSRICNSALSMRMFLFLFVLFVLFSFVLGSSVPVLHEDLMQVPSVSRNCIPQNCTCGTEASLCPVENEPAVCRPCPPYHFQPYVISTRDIFGARQCKPHRHCLAGRLITFGVSYCCSLLKLQRFLEIGKCQKLYAEI